MDASELLTFEPWADPVVDGYGVDPEGTYSRLGWLPIVGPSSWLVWGTLSAQLRRQAQVHWELTALAQAHGLQRGSGRNGVVRRTLTRLCQFGLVADDGDDRYLVRLSAPPLTRRQLERVGAVVAELHVTAFQVPRRQAG